MTKPILIGRSACNRISVLVLLGAALFPLVLPSGRSSWFAYFAMLALTAFVAGFTVAFGTGRYLISKLKTRLPEWKKEIETSGFGRFLRTKRLIKDVELLPFLQDDPARTQIGEEHKMLQTYIYFWVYLPTVLVLGMILLTVLLF